MPKRLLRKSDVEGLEAVGGETIYWDEALPGFGVRVKASGAKSYVVQYRDRASGQSRRTTIGQHGPLLTFHQARKTAQGLLADAARGKDPVAERKALRSAPRMPDLCAAYLTEHAEKKKRPASIKIDRGMIDRFLLPKLGRKRVDEITSSDLQRLHNSLSATPYQANRMLALASKMFSLAVRWGWRPDNPAKGIEKFGEQKRDRWLSDAELKRLTVALDAHPNEVAANAVRLQLLTGARVGEVLTARWEDFDLERGVWTKPSHHTKQKRTEHLPLSGAAVALLKGMREKASAAHVFPGRIPGQPIKDLKRFWNSVTVAANLPGYRLHDNRHTHASHLVSSGLSLPIVGRLLGHTNPNTTQRYAHLADDPLRAATEVMAGKMAVGREEG